ncbi:TlyA family RNA methyltransferase [Aestuariivirga sp.]|uniref:TlyA family RNA methyltransferase n=1 Tax=Aestuariivirga sp. TaxID=2650926 RepID=UPI0039E4181D
MSNRIRLDELLVQRGFYPSRSRARDAILRGTIRIGGLPATKPAQPVGVNAEIESADRAQHYVSRAALKLEFALDRFEIPVKGMNSLDIGASTGGFTQVLLERGASHVTAIDVGHGQLADMLRGDARVSAIEGLNARDLGAEQLRGAPQLIVSDVSFISLRLALPPALELAEPGAHLVALIKPQFEAGRVRIGKGGIVSDPAVQKAICDEISDFLSDRKWQVMGIVPSPIMGGDGNQEFLITARKA